MKYFVVSDTHGFYDETITALTDAGFFTCKDKKKLIICGDLMDRGPQALQLQDFILDLYHKNEVIFIRGNHEDLMMDMLLNYKKVCRRNVLWGRVIIAQMVHMTRHFN